MSSVELTVGQKAAIVEVLKYFMEGDRQVHIKGSAGTGKTTLVKHLVEEAVSGGYFSKVILTAPTNKAAKVLSSKCGVAARTIHSLLGMTMVDNEDRQELVQSREPKLGRGSVLILIDEASMVGEELMGVLEGVLGLHRSAKVLFVGDPYQLNPIGEGQSRSFGCRGVELVEVMRQAEGSKIIELAHHVKMTNHMNINELIKYHNGGDIEVMRNRVDWMKRMVEAQKGEGVAAIAWRNVRVGEINAKVRRELLGVDSDASYVVGERLLTYQPLMEVGSKVVALENSSEVTVTGVYRTRLSFDEAGVVFDGYRLLGESGGKEVQFTVAADREALNAYLKVAATAAKALPSPARGVAFKKRFFDVRDAFLDVRHAYAMTSHKSQGSTFREVYVDANDIFVNREVLERQRSLYVAVTRASEKVIILV